MHFFLLQSDPVHVFQSVLLNQLRLKFIPIYFCTYFLDLSRFERQSREKESKHIEAKRPRIGNVLGHWELS